MDAGMRISRRARLGGQPAGRGAVFPGRQPPVQTAAPQLRPSRVPGPGGTAVLAGSAPAGLVRVRPGGAARVPARPSAVPMVSAVPVLDVLRGPGQPLAAPVREEMEARLGADFSDVRVHADAAGRARAAALGARAYTLGSHVVIGDGGADKHTLAHELTHVIQQREGSVTGAGHGSGLRVSDPSGPGERAAEANAARVMRAPPQDRRLAAAARAPRAGQTTPYLVQRAPARVAFLPHKRPVRLTALSYQELERVIDILERQHPGAQAAEIKDGNVVIDLGETTRDDLLELAREELEERKAKAEPKKFNVRGRAEKTEGLVFTDNASVREIAEKNHLPVYPSGKEEAVAREYPGRFDGLTLLIDRLGVDGTKFYGRSIGSRGPRKNPAEPANKKRPAPPEEDPVIKNFRLEGPCKSGGGTPSRNTAMGGMSALNYARAVGIENAGEHTWEWLHLIGNAIGGKNQGYSEDPKEL